MTTALEIEKLLNDYRAWLKDKTTLRQPNDSWVEITTPYLDRHNDALQVYARTENGDYVLTDDSYTINDLEACGCNLATEKRQELLKMTLNGFGIRMNGEALEVHASPENFPARKHSLIQAILAVNDLFYLAQPVVESLFFEDVIAWLDSSDIRYTPKVKFTGISLAGSTIYSILLFQSRPASSRNVLCKRSIARRATPPRHSFINGVTPARSGPLSRRLMLFSMTSSSRFQVACLTHFVTIRYSRCHGAVVPK
jgi:Domain of unknown function DUF1828